MQSGLAKLRKRFERKVFNRPINYHSFVPLCEFFVKTFVRHVRGEHITYHVPTRHQSRSVLPTIRFSFLISIINFISDPT